MQTITAIYEDGVLKPTQPLDLPAHTEVHSTIEPLRVFPLTVGMLNTFLKGLPGLGDDTGEFVNDVRAIRTGFPAERNT